MLVHIMRLSVSSLLILFPEVKSYLLGPAQATLLLSEKFLDFYLAMIDTYYKLISQ